MISLGERAGSGLPEIIQGWQNESLDLRLYEIIEAEWDYSVTELRWSLQKKSEDIVRNCEKTITDGGVRGAGCVQATAPSCSCEPPRV